jgi:hypothetical protein
MKTLARHPWILVVFALLLAPSGRAADSATLAPRGAAGRLDGREAFARLKALAGQWEQSTQSGDKVVVTYRLASGGSVVMEDLFPGTEHEMITMYHLDGDALVLTHYCAFGNQPRMRLSSATPTELFFEFAGGTNLDAEKDAHVHSGFIRVVDPTHLEAEWAVYRDGKQVGANRFSLVRRSAAPR